jgi:hypothetical protein
LFERYDGSSALTIADRVIIPLYEACNPELVKDPFHSPERFAERLRAYCTSSGFDLYLALDPDTHRPLGQIFGYALPPAPVGGGE